MNHAFLGFCVCYISIRPYPEPSLLFCISKEGAGGSEGADSTVDVLGRPAKAAGCPGKGRRAVRDAAERRSLLGVSELG